MLPQYNVLLLADLKCGTELRRPRTERGRALPGHLMLLYAGFAVDIAPAMLRTSGRQRRRRVPVKKVTRPGGFK